MAEGDGYAPSLSVSKTDVLLLYEPSIRGGFAASRKIFGTSFAAPGATVIHNEIGDFCFI